MADASLSPSPARPSTREVGQWRQPFTLVPNVFILIEVVRDGDGRSSTVVVAHHLYFFLLRARRADLGIGLEGEGAEEGMEEKVEEGRDGKAFTHTERDKKN